MTRVYLGIGSNCRPEFHVRAGVAALAATFGRVDLSPVYRTPAVGFEGRDFLNLAAGIDTDWSVQSLKDWLNDLEDAHGRRRDVPKFSDRNLDIDILLYGDEVLDRDGLVLPRPEILDYAHVLKPLADLAPRQVHPLTGRTLAEHWQAFESSGALEPVDLDLASTSGSRA